jgi:serine phosphatase RsbU (regulator of sigma subunit)
MSNLPSEWELGYLSINKHDEELCGDHIEQIKKDDGSLTLVLADGLGSGVKANILSTLTSTMLSTMIDGGLSLKEAVASLGADPPDRQRPGQRRL